MKTLLAGSMFALMTFGAQAETLDVNLLRQGEQVATASDCQACHTAPGSKTAYSGGYGIASPMGTIYATNITPDSSGIGNYSETQFSEAVRHGVRADGAQLYPAMPYTSYSMMTDEDAWRQSAGAEQSADRSAVPIQPAFQHAILEHDVCQR